MSMYVLTNIIFVHKKTARKSASEAEYKVDHRAIGLMVVICVALVIHSILL